MGTALLPLHEPWKPNETLAPAASVPFQLALRIVTAEPAWV